MKIYPSKHKIKSIPTSKIDTSLNIPLAYVNIDFAKYNISKIIDPKFSKDARTILYPEQEFDNTDFLLFNDFEEVVNKENLFLLHNDKYKYYPNNIVKFSPKYFLWKATVKKNFEYSISNTYNIKIGCRNNDTLNRNLISTFMNPSERNMLVYNNIKINSNDKTFTAFTGTKNEDADIMFIRTHNCKHYDIENTEEIKIQEYLNAHTNLWLGCEDAVALNESYKMLITTTPYTFHIKSPIVSANSAITSSYYFDLGLVTPPTGVTVHNIFDTTAAPALILEYDKLGFIVITSYSILDDPVTYEGFMYEVMMYIYSHTYASTDYVEDWITYNIPDYEVTNGMYSTKSNFLSKHSIPSLLGINDNYNLVTINIKDSTAVRVLESEEGSNNTVGNISYIGQNNGRPLFIIDGALTGYTEPKKPIGWKSLYCNGSIYYVEKLHYLLEQDLTNRITMMENNNDLIVKIYSFKSSSLNINKQNDTTLKIPFIKTDGEFEQRIRDAEYAVYYDITNFKISFCFVEDYKDSPELQKLFNILVQQTDDAIDIFDMRQLGGGLSEDEKDNFELLDIGHINGRPYRIAGTLILTMPTRYKPYESYIQKALEKYKVAEDYIAIFFEDKEDDDY